MGLIDNECELTVGHLFYRIDNLGEFLERGYDNLLPILQRLLQLGGGSLYSRNHPSCLFEGPDCIPELLVQDPPVREYDDGVENAFVIRPV